MISRKQRLNRLFTFARGARAAETAPLETAPPHGFATRVVARWATEKGNGTLAQAWLRLCWWGAGSAAAICLVTALYQSSLPEPGAFDYLMEAPVMEADLF